MVHPDFENASQPGRITIASDTLNQDSPVEIEIEDENGRMVMILAIGHVALMKALMGRGARACRFVALPAQEARP